MSERAPWKSGALYAVEFKVKDSTGAGVTGLTTFTTALYLNGASSSVSATITEVGSGIYSASYTPNATGRWVLIVSNATYNVAGWQDDIQAYASDVLSGTAQTGDAYAVASTASTQAATAAAQATTAAQQASLAAAFLYGDESTKKDPTTGQLSQVVSVAGSKGASPLATKSLFLVDGTPMTDPSQIVGARFS